MSKTDGGPAFPYDHDEAISGRTGLTLRDYFAAAAMQGHLASSLYSEATLDEVASDAYRTADAMLAERDK